MLFRSNGIIKSIPGDEHNIKIIVSDAAGNASTLSFSLVNQGQTEIKNEISGQIFEPNNLNVFENDKVSFYLKDSAIYDFFHFQFKELTTASGPAYTINNDAIPVQQYFPIKIGFSHQNSIFPSK